MTTGRESPTSRSGRKPSANRFNIEIKARCGRLEEARAILIGAGAVSHGVDRQVDTYFTAPDGRLKVREGRIENALIAYERPDEPGPRPSAVCLAPLTPESAAGLREILGRALPLAARVVKEREILFLGNIKFHLDRVEALGTFVEVEAISEDGVPPREVLEAQAAEWQVRLGLDTASIEPRSYSDLLTRS